MYIFSFKGSHLRYSVKKVYIKISENSQKNTDVKCLRNKVASLQSCNCIKKGLQSRVFSCEICKIFQNTNLKNIYKLLTASNSFFLMALITILFFSVQAQTEIIEEWWSKSPLCRLYFPQCLRAYNHAENILRLTTGSFDFSFPSKPQNKLRLLKLYTLILSCGVFVI